LIPTNSDTVTYKIKSTVVPRGCNSCGHWSTYDGKCDAMPKSSCH